MMALEHGSILKKRKTMSDITLSRKITLAELLKTESRIKFEKEHVPCYGIYDDLGLESVIRIDTISVESLDKAGEDMRSLKLRARFNIARNAHVYLVWLHKNSLHLIDKLIEKKDFKRAKQIIIKHGYKC